MKTLLAFAVALMIVTTGYAAKPEEAIIIGQTKSKSLFVYKTRKFVGAMVEVYTSDGDLLTAQNLEKRKLIIDFGSAIKDTYTIRVVKGGEVREFQFVNR